MICPKCQKELPEDSLFCSGCGYSFKGEEKLAVKIKKIIIGGVIALIALIVIAFGGLFINKQIQSNKRLEGFKELVEAENYKEALTYYEDNGIDNLFIRKADKYSQEQYEEAEANENEDKKLAIFNASLLPNDYVAQIEEKIAGEIEELQNSYVAEKIEYRVVKSKCDIYAKYKSDSVSTKAKDVNDYSKSLDDSRNAYKSGMEAVEAKDYEKALDNLSKVIEEDSNYDSAQAKIPEVVELYKTEVMGNVDKQVESNNYAAAITSLESLNKYCSDSDVSSKLTVVKSQKETYEEEQEKLKIEGYKNSQQVEVTSTRVYNGGYYITLMRAEVKIRNNSDKVAKDVSFGLLLFDSNGYPVDVEWTMYQGTHSNELNCEFNSCNVTSGGSFGGDRYYDVPDNCHKAKACVKKVTYTDGTIWKNPYYEYWLKDNYNSY